MITWQKMSNCLIGIHISPKSSSSPKSATSSGFGAAGLCSWMLTVVIASVVFTQCKASVNWDGIAPEPIFATTTVVSTIIFTWFCYEAFKLSAKMSPDEYMKGVIYFYTDMFYVCMCCALLACLGSAGGGSGAPETEEEAPER